MNTQAPSPKKPRKKTIRPPTLPETGYVRMAQLLGFIPLSAATIYRKCKFGTFPPYLKLTPRTTAWRAEDIRAWMDAQGLNSEKGRV
jgi:prophage regulatory protein